MPVEIGRLRSVLPLIWLPLLSACTLLDAHRTETKPADGSDILGLIEYSNQIAGKTPVELMGEYILLEETLEHTPRPEAKLRMALLLATRSALTEDRPRARQLLGDVSNESKLASPGQRSFARLMIAFINEQEAIEQTMIAELEQRQATIERQQTTIDRQLRDLRLQLGRERERRAELEQKLDALRALEDTLHQRNYQPQ